MMLQFGLVLFSAETMNYPNDAVALARMIGQS
jgi:hypothetical protein